MKFSLSTELKRPWYLVVMLPAYRAIHRWRPSWLKPQAGIKTDIYASAMLREGNWLFNLIFPPFFKKIRHEVASEEKLREAISNGTIVYVMRKRGQLEFNYFGHLFNNLKLPLVTFANDISLRRWMRWPKLKASILVQMDNLDKLGGIADPLSSGYIKHQVEKNHPIILSLTPSELEDETVILSYSQKMIRTVISVQKNINTPIYLVPLEVIWDRRPAKTERTIIDILFGEKENPGRIRKMVLFWRNYRHRAVVRIGNPIDLSQVISAKSKTSDEGLAKKLGHDLLSALRLERRTISGPPIRPKSWFIERVLTDESFQQNLCTLAAELRKPADDLQELAKRYITEIAADINYTYIELAILIMKGVFKSLYSGLVYNKEGLKNIKQLYATTPIVFVPNHKSHFDYLLLSYILHNNYMTIPMVAAGLNLSFWPLGAILRRCGAYFIRRSFTNNKLYKACVETYIKVLLEEGYSQEVFIEGERSRTGKLMPPKHGIMRMLVEQTSADPDMDINFIPVSLTYDHVLEQKVYGKELEGAAKEKEKPSQVLRLFKYLKHQKPRHGKIYINFGEPISYRQTIKNIEMENASNSIINDVCHEINRNIVVTPKSLVALAILSHTERGSTLVSLNERTSLFLNYLRYKGVNLSQGIFLDPDAAISTALEGLVSSKLITGHDEALEAFYSFDEDKRLQLEYFKNGCSHFFASIGVFSVLLVNRLGKNTSLSLDQIVDEFLYCKELLKYEFQFSTRLSPEKHLQKILDYLASQNVIALEKNGQFKLKKGADAMLTPFSNIVRNFFESQKIALASIKRESFKKKDERDLVKKMIQTGKNMLLLGHIHYREAVSKVNFSNALPLFCDLGILRDHSKELGTKGRKVFSTTNNKQLIQNLQVQLEKLT